MRRYPDLFTRLVSNTHEPENAQACWLWARKKDRSGYGRLNLYVPGLKARVILQAHVLAYVVHEGRPEDADEAWLMYQDFVASGLEIDHLCRMPACLYADHHEPVTPAENCRRREERRASARW